VHEEGMFMRFLHTADWQIGMKANHNVVALYFRRYLLKIISGAPRSSDNNSDL
jgi:hypothetical protein